LGDEKYLYWRLEPKLPLLKIGIAGPKILLLKIRMLGPKLPLLMISVEPKLLILKIRILAPKLKLRLLKIRIVRTVSSQAAETELTRRDSAQQHSSGSRRTHSEKKVAIS
jgi:hypothetical protein